ncbi:MAG TPA: arsenic resistance N-acetyltransferase ArsN2 [Gemmatimonadaceae bacterium]|jgi:N-acetylglutamate synthase-like GNAT family acetyltransferase
MDVITIRVATMSDLAAIETLLTQSELPTEGVSEALGAFLVAEAPAGIIGVVGLELRGDYGLLRSTAVRPEWRGQRVAKRLVERLIADAKSRNIRALYLLTTTAEGYFPSLGFRMMPRDDAPEEIHATDEFRGACPASATLMSLSLQP